VDLFAHHSVKPATQKYDMMSTGILVQLDYNHTRVPILKYLKYYQNTGEPCGAGNRMATLQLMSENENHGVYEGGIQYYSIILLCTFTITGITSGKLEGSNSPLRASSAKAKQPPCQEPSPFSIQKAWVIYLCNSLRKLAFWKAAR
jgi:hypothetical protein